MFDEKKEKEIEKKKERRKVLYMGNSDGNQEPGKVPAYCILNEKDFIHGYIQDKEDVENVIRIIKVVARAVCFLYAVLSPVCEVIGKGVMAFIKWVFE